MKQTCVIIDNQNNKTENFKKLLIIIILVGLISCKATQKAPVKTTYDVVLTDITNSSKLIAMNYVFALNKLNIEEAKKQ